MEVFTAGPRGYGPCHVLLGYCREGSNRSPDLAMAGIRNVAQRAWKKNNRVAKAQGVLKSLPALQPLPDRGDVRGAGIRSPPRGVPLTFSVESLMQVL